MSERQAGFAFYDLDGTLVSSNVVTQYAWFARHQPSLFRSAYKTAKLVLSVPFLIGLDLYSRAAFNVVFYQEYRGMRREWLESRAEEMFNAVVRPATYAGAKPLIEKNRAAGYRNVLVTGSLDFALAPVKRYLGFDDVICNALVFENGIATGELRPPLIAGKEKVEEMHRLCREYNVETRDCLAYSDSVSDLPMLEAVGRPTATNPGKRLRKIAEARGWPILDLKDSANVD